MLLSFHNVTFVTHLLASFKNHVLICCWEEAIKRVVSASLGNWLSHLLDILEKFVVPIYLKTKPKLKKCEKGNANSNIKETKTKM